MKKSDLKERLGRWAVAGAACLSVIAVISIFGFLLVRSLPALQKIGVRELLGGTEWTPDRLDRFDSLRLSGSYGMLPMIVGSACATLGALLVGGVAGYFTAVFLAFFCPVSFKRPFSLVIHLLAGIPSVVYGFFGIAVVLPMLSRIAPNNGSGLLAVSLILGLMILPTVVSLSHTALYAVPRSYYDASVSLGATHTETVFRVMIPAARSGIGASLILGVGRALGETMAVVMVAGNAPIFPVGAFGSFRTMTANIVMEMGYAGEVQEGALVACGVILLAFILLINLLFSGLARRAVTDRVGQSMGTSRAHRYLAPLPRIGKGLAYSFGFLSALALALILGFILGKGLPPLLSDPHILFGKYEFGSDRITILPALLVTLMALVASILIAVPIGIMTAVYLCEYARQNSRLAHVLRIAIDVLGGVPSIVYGLFGMIAFLPLLGGSSSILAGSLTISMMLLPTVVRSTEESLRAVPDTLRAGSLALGAGKVRTVVRIVIPAALPGILSAVVLSMGRVISESAPFLYTMGSVISALPKSYLDSGASLAVALYQLSGEGWYLEEAYATAAILILLVLGINALTERLSRRLIPSAK